MGAGGLILGTRGAGDGVLAAGVGVADASSARGCTTSATHLRPITLGTPERARWDYKRVTDSASARGARDKPDCLETARLGVDSGAGEARVWDVSGWQVVLGPSGRYASLIGRALSG